MGQDGNLDSERSPTERTEIRARPFRQVRLDEGAPSPLFRAVFTLVLGNAVWFLRAHRFVPAVDFPEWEYQGLILSRFIRGVSPAAYSIKPYPVPHSITAVLGALLNLVLSPEFSGKVVLKTACVHDVALVLLRAGMKAGLAR